MANEPGSETVVVRFHPQNLSIRTQKGKTFLNVIQELGLYLPSDCGGMGKCGKCKIKIVPSPEANPFDVVFLSQSEMNAGVRLACIHKLTRDCEVFLLTQGLPASILVEGLERRPPIPDDGLHNQIGVAIDIGTTTVVCYFVDLGTNSQIGTAAFLNPQSQYGEDVISRLAYALNTPNGLETLQKVLIGRLQKTIQTFLQENKIDSRKVTRISIVGNTAMQHIFLKVPVSSLAHAPYTPRITHSVTTTAKDVGLSSLVNAEVYVSPCVAGFVGGDTLGVVLSQELDQTTETILALDVGTNGEIVLCHHKKLYCCSTAAGPAFEGAMLTCGMRAQEGAITRVTVKDENTPPELITIGNVQPRGLCGSGVIDLLAELLKIGIVDTSGRLRPSARVRDDKSKSNRYYLVFSSGNLLQDIILTQQDIRQIQLAKAAIRAGIEILLQQVSLDYSDIKILYLAGAFGNYISPANAIKIGLLPPLPLDRIVAVGNAAGIGAKHILVSSQERAKMEHIARSMHYVELAGSPIFEELFVRFTQFPKQCR